MQKEYTCPLEYTIDTVGGKWKLLILWHVAQKDCRFTDLLKLFPDISKKVLSQNLKELEGANLIARDNVISHFRDYYITTKGMELQPALNMLEKWGKIELKKTI